MSLTNKGPSKPKLVTSKGNCEHTRYSGKAGVGGGSNTFP